jgi:hypothetical protein
MLIGIDDSEIWIEGRLHTILAAIGVREPCKVNSALNELKEQFGLAPSDEVKWNGMKPMPQQVREALSQELMILLHDSVPLIVISEGRSKQLAAERMANQLAEFLRTHPYSFDADKQIELVFDEGIIGDEVAYSEYLRTLSPSPVASGTFATAHSHESAVIQLADVLAGFNRLATDIALGHANKKLTLWDDGLGRDIEIDLLNYISIALRWAMWGEVAPPPDPSNVTFDGTWPFKHIGGYGLQICSTVSPQTIEQIYKSRTVYMGCMH